MIVVGGMIGLGKTSVSQMLGEALHTKVLYEKVDGNRILPLFYKASEEESKRNRYPFLLQLEFLNSRFHAIKDALRDDNSVMDRSIYEDWYFAKKNEELGRISPLEMGIYEGLLENMMEELDSLPKKSPDLMVYLKGSFETVLKRIQMRGRTFELGDELVDYYRFLWEGYDDWIYHCYSASPVITIDMDNTDIVHNPEDWSRVFKEIEAKLDSIHQPATIDFNKVLSTKSV